MSRSVALPDFDSSAPLIVANAELLPKRVNRLLKSYTGEEVTVLGDPRRLLLPAVTMVGSRKTPGKLLTAAASLARVLSDEVGPVVSGMAAGADSAALAGAVRGRSGAIVIPACGLARVPKRALALAENSSATFLGLFPFYAPFNAGYAIQRNSVLAAMGRALVLVASDLKGGSTYAINWALAHGIPVFCFESGASTPAANAHLIRTGRAMALSLKENPSRWADQLAIAMEKRFSPPNGSTRAAQLGFSIQNVRLE